MAQALRYNAGPASQTPEEWTSQSYSMKKQNNMGQVVIFNNKTFDYRVGRNVRIGTDKDAECMGAFFSSVGFNVNVYPDCTKDEMIQIMEKVSDLDHSSSNCFVCIILSHGMEGVVYGKDHPVYVDELLSKIKGENCKSLAGKPKIVLVQACVDDFHVPDDDEECLENEEATDDEEIEQKTIPEAADFIIAESLVPGWYAWKDNGSSGSWFIQTVNDVFSRKWQQQDVPSMLTQVKNKVYKLLERKGMQNECKIPKVTSYLRKELHLCG